LILGIDIPHIIAIIRFAVWEFFPDANRFLHIFSIGGSWFISPTYFSMFEKLKAILVEDMSVNEHDINLDSELMSDLGLNSIELQDLILLCEERFELEFDEEEFKNFVTVRDVVNYLELNANI
jgi:acyl carrier protein